MTNKHNFKAMFLYVGCLAATLEFQLQQIHCSRHNITVRYQIPLYCKSFSKVAELQLNTSETLQCRFDFYYIRQTLYNGDRIPKNQVFYDNKYVTSIYFLEKFI